jgi:hypothetical protein
MARRVTTVTAWRFWGIAGATAIGVAVICRPRCTMPPLLPPDDNDDPVKQALRSSSTWH